MKVTIWQGLVIKVTQLQNSLPHKQVGCEQKVNTQ